MIRRLAALGLAVAVELAALSAPFVHVHADDHDTDHHAAHAVHTHLAGHRHARHDQARDGADDHHATGPAGHHAAAPSGPVVEAESEHTRFIQLFSAIKPASFVVAMIPPAAFDLPAPAESPAHRPVAVTHGHDPPSLRLQPSRAPPLSYLS